MKHCIPIFIAIIGFVHFSHVTFTLGLSDEDVAYLFEEWRNDTNGTTVAPGNLTTTPSPANETTTASHSNETTTETPSNGTTTAPGPSNQTTTEYISTTHKPTDAPSPGKSGSGRSFDGVSFVGGIILGLGVLVLAFVAYRLYHRRTSQGYNAM